MPLPLKIEIAKHPDGSGVLSCTRADGSRTWQKLKSNVAPHFALHDLTHYTVETTLGYKHAFFGLICEGWDIEDTTGKGARGTIPKDATDVERIVGLLDLERSTSTPMSLDDFNANSPRLLTEAEVGALRTRRAELFALWRAVAPGEKLELVFD